MNRKLIFGIFILMFLLVGTVSASYVTIEDLNYAGDGNGGDNKIETTIQVKDIDYSEIVFKYSTLSSTASCYYGAYGSGTSRYHLFKYSNKLYMGLGSSYVQIDLTPYISLGNIYKFSCNKDGSTYTINLYEYNSSTSSFDFVYTQTVTQSVTSTDPVWIYNRYGVNSPLNDTIYYLRINDETWEINKGYGSTITGDQGTELTIQGTLTDFWQPTDFWDQSYLQISSLQKGLVGYWTLDQDNYNSNTNRVTDKSGHENHGTNYGATSTTDRFGNVNSAMSFNSNYIQINYYHNVPTGTLSYWFKYDSSDTQGITGTNDGSRRLYVGIYDSNTFYAGFGNTYVTNIDFSEALVNGNWYLLTITGDGSTARLYLNSVYVGQFSYSFSGTSTAPFKIADLGRLDSAHYYQKGDIDDIRIYNRALSAEEVKLLYESHKPQISGTSLNKGLILDMPLTSRYTKTETAGSEILTDRTPYSNDGINHGATLSSENLYFSDSDNDYVLSTETNLMNYSQTFFAWVYPEATNDLRGIVGNHYHSDFSNIGLNVYAGTLSLSIGYTDNTREYLAKRSSTIYANQWTQVASVFNLTNNSIKIYLNGNLDKTWDIDKTVKFSSRKILLGQWASSYLDHYKFKGNISNVKVYNRALSETEIQQLYDQGR